MVRDDREVALALAIRCLCAAAAAVALAGCSRPDYDVSDAAAFQASCAEVSGRLASALRLNGLGPGAVADVLLMAAKAPTYDDAQRRLDPGRPPAAAGADAFSTASPEAPCAEAAKLRSQYDGVGAWASLDLGLSHWMASLSAQAADVKRTKDEIRDVVEGRKSTSGRVADLLGSFAPRGLGYAVATRGGRLVPTIKVAAFNPLDKPIQAMFLAVDLKRPDGSVLAQGRFTFTPAEPLNPNVGATYDISLDGVSGFTNPALADLRGNVTVAVKVEDVVSGGIRLLNDTLLDPQDLARIDALGIVQGRIDDFRAFVRRVREREATAR